jgi:hypothetical protein
LLKSPAKAPGFFFDRIDPLTGGRVEGTSPIVAMQQQAKIPRNSWTYQ